MKPKRLGLLGFMNHYNVETDSTVGGNYGLHDQVDFQNDQLKCHFETVKWHSCFQVAFEHLDLKLLLS